MRIEGLVLRRHDGSVKVFDTAVGSKKMFFKIHSNELNDAW